ncbi:3-oxoacyl- reductase [Penicillium macrosclerotiorum]|uniref:3-oxoacyl- reductase n=1 Tax=Penicillium macrosclerotiorum TaxID=303699 RepID=UPI0025466B7A|nr:3-oxoacyl- reductase [Penicillium macrosclerotiorum]KAJ5688738.1 3-oxoacyl- reductase [Penicillium macrosclerotiorum]
MSLKGKVAIVSGSSSGIGAAIAQELSSRGAHIVVNYPTYEQRAQAESVLQSLSGPTSTMVEADLSSLQGPMNLVMATVAEFGRIDILVNNAAVMGPSALDASSTTDLLQLWDAMINVNCRGTMLLTREVLKHLSPSHSRIINICSSTSRDPDPNMTFYAGTKGMIESFTRCWAKDLPRKYGCTVNAIAPGPTATQAMLSTPPVFQAIIKDRTDRTPVAPRLGKPEEIAWTVAMLCEEKAGWLNGLYIPVAGGGLFV